MSLLGIRSVMVFGCLCLVAVAASGQEGDRAQRAVLNFLTSRQSPEAESAARRIAKRISVASQILAKAETDEERADAEGQLREAVAERFDLIVKEREEQIAELQARLEQLQEQLAERQAAKDEIVDLRVKVLINEAKGLGFYPPQNGASRQSNPYSSGMFGHYPSADGPMAEPTSTPRPSGNPLRGR